VKDSRIVDDYDFEIAYEGPREGVRVYEFVLTPKPEAPVVWGRIEEQVRIDDLMPVWVRYFDEDGELVRTLTFSDYQSMGGRMVPATMLIIPADKPEESTRMTYRNLEFDIEIEEDFFSLRNLRARR